MILRGSGEGRASVMLLRAAMQDARLSYRARGILAAVMSRPDDWRNDIELIAAGGREGERAVAGALRELARLGYLRRERVRASNGRLATEWVITDDPALLAPPVTSPAPPRRRPERTSPPAPRAATTASPAATSPAASALAGEVETALPQIRFTPRVLHAEAARLAADAWTPDQLRSALGAHDWAGARAGAVVAWLRDLTPDHRPAPAPAPRLPWCGDCDPASRRLLDAEERPIAGSCCPACGGAAPVIDVTDTATVRL